MQMNPADFQKFKAFVKKKDKERGNTYALGMIQTAVFFNKLDNDQVYELIKVVLE